MISHKPKKPKIALIYDKVNTPYGGAEHVLQAIQELFPNAPLFTSVYSEKKASWARFFKIKTTFLQKIKPLRSKHQLMAFFMPLAFESLNLDKFDVVISITSAEAKGVLTKPNQLHICYMLTPTRYLHSHRNQYMSSIKLLTFPPIKFFANLSLNYLSWWDKSAAYRPDIIIPISKLIKSRIKKYYNLNSDEVIYPPVDTSLRKLTKEKINNHFYLSLSRLVDYKKIDLSIKAALKLQKTLVIVGSGIQKRELKKIAINNYIEKKENESILELMNRAKKLNKKIIFTGIISEYQVNCLLTNCKALLMPGEEDFGITGLEASILGKPVIVFYKSGIAEILKDNTSAIFIKKETEQEIVRAIKKMEKINFNSKLIKAQARKYDTQKFKKTFEKKVLNSWDERTLCHI